MKCPHCNVTVHVDFHEVGLGLFGRSNNENTMYSALHAVCPACRDAIILLQQNVLRTNGWVSTKKSGMIYPKGTARPPVPEEVPVNVADDYREACLVFDDSPKASAALSRRCLQQLLADTKLANSDNLATAIDEALSKHLPTPIATDLDAIREIGNFASHPRKSTNSGEVMDVEEGEAEWNLDVLEALFDYCYVKPEQSRVKRQAINKKLKEAGKKPIKEPPSKKAKPA